MNCPECGGKAIEVKWNEVPSHVGYCPVCDLTFLLDGKEDIFLYASPEDAIKGSGSSRDLHEEIPELPLGTVVYVNNTDHFTL